MNHIELVGRVLEEPVFSHTIRNTGTNYYKFPLSVKRFSGFKDILPVVIPERLKNQVDSGGEIFISGRIQSYAVHEHMHFAVTPREIIPVIDKTPHENHVEVSGVICRQPRKFDSQNAGLVCVSMLAVYRNNNRCDYINFVTWGRNAKTVSEYSTGTVLKITGRIQSREVYKENASWKVYEIATKEVEIEKGKTEEVDNRKLCGDAVSGD